MDKEGRVDLVLYFITKCRQGGVKNPKEPKSLAFGFMYGPNSHVEG